MTPEEAKEIEILGELAQMLFKLAGEGSGREPWIAYGALCMAANMTAESCELEDEYRQFVFDDSRKPAEVLLASMRKQSLKGTTMQ